ncbi:MAG: rRNA maturation RNase YbeY [Polyangiales bacterium]
MTIRVLRTARGRAALAPATVRRRGRRMLAALGLEDAELSILLCDDTVMRELNRRHRGLDRTTDVLAFAMREGEPSPAAGMLGDIVISEPTARANARASSRLAKEEITFLLAHGLLHLLGDDHRTRTQERRMTARTHMLIAATAGPDAGRVDSSSSGSALRGLRASIRGLMKRKKRSKRS